MPTVPYELDNQVYNWLYNLILGAYSAINHTQASLTQSCWLCLSVSPPYYEEIASSRSYITHSSGSNWDWDKSHKLTLSEITGQGTCIGNPPPHIKTLCAAIYQTNNEDKFLQPPVGLKWACDTGVTPCVSTKVFNSSTNFCVMVSIYPRIYYLSEVEFNALIDQTKTRYKREPVSITLAVILGTATMVSIGTGAAAVIHTNQQTSQLRMAVDHDLKKIETSVMALTTSLNSLSEVVLQNPERT